jgi:PAS domain-containing protein
VAKTTAERQADYRKRRNDGEGDRRINAWVAAQADLALQRLAERHQVTKREMLEQLILRAAEAEGSILLRETPSDLEMRSRAEVRVGERMAVEDTSVTGGLSAAGDPARLHHELQVHQVELEMQNTELRQARDSLEAALEQYTDLYDFAPVGYFTLERNGTISRVNLTGSSLMGVERSRLVGERFERYLAGPSRPDFRVFLEKAYGSQGKTECELALLKNGLPLWVQLEGGVIGTECRLALIDITERKFDINERKLAKRIMRLTQELVKERDRAERAEAAFRNLRQEKTAT